MRYASAVNASVCRLVWRLVLVAWSVALLACGPARYIPAIRGAESSVEDAKDAGAATYAPYWYTRATAFLSKAKEEAASADYGRALEFAEVARTAAERAKVQSKDRGPATERGESDD